MIKKTKSGRIIINLDGPQGNAFFLMGCARNLLSQFMDKGYVENIIKEMQSGDYENLIKVFDRELGIIVDLETSNKDLLKCKS